MIILFEKKVIIVYNLEGQFQEGIDISAAITLHQFKHTPSATCNGIFHRFCLRLDVSFPIFSI